MNIEIFVLIIFEKIFTFANTTTSIKLRFAFAGVNFHYIAHMLDSSRNTVQIFFFCYILHLLILLDFLSFFHCMFVDFCIERSRRRRLHIEKNQGKSSLLYFN